jgi:hypothetical protein
MPANDPATAFAAVVHQLAPNADEAQHMVRHGGQAAVTVGKAVLAALKAGQDDSEAGCKALLKALAPAADEARDLARHGNDRQMQVSKALLAAQAGASAIDWHAKPALGKVTIVTGPGDVQASATAPVMVRTALKRDGDLTAAASCGWSYTGLAATPLTDIAVFPAGSAVGAAAVTVPPRPGMAEPLAFEFAILGGPGDLVGLTLGEPHTATGRLLPPAVVDPGRSVVSVAQGFDALVLSATAPTTGQAALGRTGDTTAALVVPVTVSGLQDGDLAAPVAPAAFAAGAAQATVTLQFGPGTTGAPARAAHLAIDASGGLFDVADPAGFDFAVREPGGVVPKGTITFPSAIGTVIRQPAAEKTVMVEVAREGVSTHQAATIPVVSIQLPPDVLQAVGPAEFGAGQRIGHAPMVLKPYGAGLAAKPRRTPGKAALRATADFDLGANASQDFTVQDGQDVQPGDNVFHLPGLDLGPLKFMLGMSMGWGDDAAWIKTIGRRPLCCSGGSHKGRTGTWEGVRGGAKGAIGNGTQLDVQGTNFGAAFGIVKPGSPELLAATWKTVPDNIKATDYADLANGGHDNDAYIMGWNAWLLMKSKGFTGAQLVVRGDKEYNGGGYGVSTANAALRAKWLARFIAQFNKGYMDAGADARPRHILGLARHEQMGPVEAHVPIGPGGQVMVDAIDLSWHPAGALNGLVGKPRDQQKAAAAAWIRGEYDGHGSCYAPDHASPQYSTLAAAKAHGIKVTASETLPRDDGALACHIAGPAWEASFEWWTEHADMVGFVGVYHNTALNRGLNVPGWADGYDTFVRLAKGG